MNGHLAILLPGRGYGALGPALRLPRLAVEQSGAEVVEIDYGSVPAADDPESWERLYVSVAEQIGTAVSERNPSQLTFIAKSLGTIVLASLPAEVPLPSSVRAVWLAHAGLRTRIGAPGCYREELAVPAGSRTSGPTP